MPENSSPFPPWRVASHEAWKATALRYRVWDATRTFHGSPQHIREHFALLARSHLVNVRPVPRNRVISEFSCKIGAINPLFTGWFIFMVYKKLKPLGTRYTSCKRLFHLELSSGKGAR
jgi:hypothetical protein